MGANVRVPMPGPQEKTKRVLRRASRSGRLIPGLLVLTAAATLLGTAFAAGKGSRAAPTSSFTGTASGGGGSTSSFTGSGTVGGSGGGEGDGFGSDDSGSFGQEGDGGGALVLPSSGPGGALSGMTASDVRLLQTSLARLGFFHHAVTGYYGAVTTAAVKKFQRSAGLKADGIWGTRSASALTKRLG
jgi:hypothetical protein